MDAKLLYVFITQLEKLFEAFKDHKVYLQGLKLNDVKLYLNGDVAHLGFDRVTLLSLQATKERYEPRTATDMQAALAIAKGLGLCNDADAVSQLSLDLGITSEE